MSTATKARSGAGTGALGRLRTRTRTFAAVLWPGGIELIRYREQRRTTSVVSNVRELADFGTIQQAAARLAAMIEAEGGRGGSVVVALRGFGSSHRFLSLPLAPVDVVRPIVEREMLRYDPELRDPRVAIVRVRKQEEETPPKQDIFAAAVPALVVDQLNDALGRHGIELRHLTVVPRALQRLHNAFVGGDETALLLLLLPGAPIAGAFLGDRPLLIREPPLSAAGPAFSAPLAAEMVTRTALFVRQQSGGTIVQRLFIAGTAEELDAVAAALPSQAGFQAQPLGTRGASAGTLAALGAALDALEPDPLDLLPRADDAAKRRAASAKPLVAVAAGALLLAAFAWAYTGLMSERRSRQQFESLESAVVERTPSLQAMQPTVEARMLHAQRIGLIDQVGSGKRQVGLILNAVEQASPNGIRYDSLRVAAAEGGWSVFVGGVVNGSTNTIVFRRVNQLYKGIQARLPLDTIGLNYLQNLPRDTVQTSIAARFGISFIVSFGENP